MLPYPPSLSPNPLSPLPFSHHSSHNPFLSQQQIQSYQSLINQIQDDLTQISIGRDQHLVDYQLKENTFLNVQRNNMEGTVNVRLDISCSIEKDRKDYQTSEKNRQEQINCKELEKLREKNKEKEQVISMEREKYKEISKENQQFLRVIAKLNVYVLELQTVLTLFQIESNSNKGVNREYQLQHKQYEDNISLIQKQLQQITRLNSQQLKPNTLKILRGEQISIIQLQTLQPSQSTTSPFLTLYGSQQLLTIQQLSKPSNTQNKQVQLQPPFQLQNKSHIITLNQQAINQNNYLRTQMVQLIEQLQTLKIDYKKLNNLLIDYEVRLSNNRDFYKLKLVDLERMVQEKTKFLRDLDEEIENTQRLLQEKTNGCQTIDQLVGSYSTTIKHISNQYEEQVYRNGNLTVKMDGMEQFYKNQLEKHKQVIENLTTELDHQSKCANQVHIELNELKEINSDLKGVIQKLWSEIKYLNDQYRQKQRECIELKQSNNNEQQRKRQIQDIDDMKIIIDNINSQVTELHKQLFLKQSELEQLKYFKVQKEQQLYDYEQQKKLQLNTIQKLRLTTQKANDRIYFLESQLDQTKSKLQYQQTVYSNNINHNQYDNQIDLNIDFSLLKNKNLVSQLKGMRFGNKQSHFELVLKLIEIIEEYTADIDNLEGQNNELKGLVGEYEEIIEDQLQEIKDIKGEIERIEIKRQREHRQPQNRLGKTTLNNIRNHFRQTTQSYFSSNSNKSKKKVPSQNHLHHQSNQLYQQLVVELQQQRKSNISLTYKLKQVHKQLMDYERQIFQKTQAINYLNLALIKASTSVQQSDSHISQSFQQLQQQNQNLQNKFEEIFQQKQSLQRSIRKILNNKNKQIQTLQYQINVLDNNVIPQLKQSNTHYLDIIQKLQSQNKKLLKQIDNISKSIHSHQDKRSLKTNLTFQQIKTRKFPYLTLLYIILRLGQTLLSTNHTQSFHPQDIYLINFNQFDAPSFRIKLADCGGQHENGFFNAPECVNGQEESEESIAWNYGLILDYVWNKEPYYVDQRQLKEKSKSLDYLGVYEGKGKMPEGIRRLVQGLVLKDKRKRLRVEECLGVIRAEIEKNS